MAATLPPGTLVDREGGGLRISLPRRPLGKGRCAGIFLIAFGSVFGGGPLLGVLDSIRSESGCFAVFIALFILPFVVIGLGLVALGMGILFPRRATIALERARLKTTERFGPFWWSWRAPREKVRSFQVRRFSEGVGQEVSGLLEMEVEGRAKPFTFGRAYPVDWLEAAGHALSEVHGGARLAETVDAPRPATAEPAPATTPAERPAKCDVALEYTADSVRLTVPPKGIWKANGCMFAFGILWSIMCGIMLAMSIANREWDAVIGLVLFVLPGAALILGAVHTGRRTATLELCGGSLSFRTAGLFRRRVRQWPRNSIREIRAEESGWKVNGVAQWRLRVELAEGKPIKLLGWRPREEMEWAASVLRSGPMGRVETAPAEVKLKGAECQVCNSPLTGAVVYCARCRTPHHEQCWQYMGQCSTYGCREIRYTAT